MTYRIVSGSGHRLLSNGPTVPQNRLYCIPAIGFLSPPVKVPLPPSAKANVIYQFQCGRCQDIYLGRTERQMELLVSERIPVWFREQLTQPTHDTHTRSTQTRRTPQSSIGKHVLEPNHWSDPATTVRVIYAASNKRLLQFMEASAIKRLKPALCKQKELFVTLALPS